MIRSDGCTDDFSEGRSVSGISGNVLSMKKHIRILPLVLTALLYSGLMSACDKDSADAENTVLSAVTEQTIPISTAEKTTSSAQTVSVSSAAPAETSVTTGSREEHTETTTSVSVPETADTSYTEVPAAEQTTAALPDTKAAKTDTSSVTQKTGSRTAAEETTVQSSVMEEQVSGQSESVISQETTGVVSETAAVTYDPYAPFTAKASGLRPYSYDFISEKSLYIYDALITAIEQKKTSVKFSSVMNLTSEDYCAVYQLIYNDECSMFYLDTKMQYAVNSATKNVASANIFYRYSDDEIERMQSVIDGEADRIIAMITPEMSEYDVVKLFYDYLAENVVYDEETENCRDIYGVFADHRAICGGYAKAMEYLCSKVGIEAITITGDADGVPHMWNMVRLGGEWYHVDPTYAVTESKVGPYVRYDYFCVTDDVISRSRTVYEQDYKYPEASSELCNYYVKNGLVADSWADVKQMLTDQVLEAAKEKRLVAEIQCSSKETYDEAAYKLFDRTQAQAIPIMQNALPEAENKYQCENISYSQDPNTYVIKLFLEYTD